MAVLHSCTLSPFGKSSSSVPRPLRFQSLACRGTLAIDSSSTFGVDHGDGVPPKLLLEVKDLTAVIAESKQQILKGVNLVVREGEVLLAQSVWGVGKKVA